MMKHVAAGAPLVLRAVAELTSFVIKLSNVNVSEERRCLETTQFHSLPPAELVLVHVPVPMCQGHKDS
jgi:hypothetical protein